MEEGSCRRGALLFFFPISFFQFSVQHTLSKLLLLFLFLPFFLHLFPRPTAFAPRKTSLDLFYSKEVYVSPPLPTVTFLLLSFHSYFMYLYSSLIAGKKLGICEFCSGPNPHDTYLYVRLFTICSRFFNVIAFN